MTSTFGTITPGTSSPLTAGASALLVMSEDKAKSLGFKPLAYLKSWAFAGIDPAWQMLMGPAFAAPKALDRAGLKLSDVDLVDMHEAFAAQVLSNLQALASASWSAELLGRPWVRWQTRSSTSTVARSVSDIRSGQPAPASS